MRKGNLTREQAIEIVGAKLVDELESENCDFSNRVMDYDVEFTASVKFVDNEGIDRVLIAYYYQDQDAVREVENLDGLDWEIEGFEID